MPSIEFGDDRGEGAVRAAVSVATAASLLTLGGIVYHNIQYAPRVCEGYAVLLDGPSNSPRTVVADPLIRHVGPTLMEAEVQPDGEVDYTDSTSLENSAWFTADGRSAAYPGRGGCTYVENGEIAAGQQVNVPTQVDPGEIVNDAVRNLFVRMDAPVIA